MKVLVVGGGGREHALVKKAAASKKVSKIFCAPGNAGTGLIAENVAIKATELEKIRDFALEQEIDLVIVAPDDPLAMGLVDLLTEAGLRAFGPKAAAAKIEASKAFAKELMSKYHIPTAAYEVFTEQEAALNYLDNCVYPLVVKADGLALGKGVIIAGNKEAAQQAVSNMMSGESFGSAGRTIVLEEFLQGAELTILAFTDGKTVKSTVSSRDHKRAFDHDQGLNTGGMGAIAPVMDLSMQDSKLIDEEIIKPTIAAMAQEGCTFKGVIYFGLMLTADGPKVIEYNARFGDPEAQVVLPLLETDLIEIMEACIEERLDQLEIKWSGRHGCVVVMASGGYPEAYETGKLISGLEEVENQEDVEVFHAGTKSKDGRIYTAGGRVLGITALGDSQAEAVAKAYHFVKKISFENCHYRTDIGRVT